MRNFLTLPDKILIAVLLALGFASLWVMPGVGQEGEIVLIEQNGRLLKKLPLAREAQVGVEGPLGVTVVKVEDGKARVVDSPCPRKFCTHRGAINKAGEMIVCVPNKVVVRIKGREEIDAVAQ